MTTSFDPGIARGTVITGKWKRRRYLVERMLGEGANGKVYLVERDRVRYALKVSADVVDLQSEINVLQSLADQRTSEERSFLVDVDDYCHPEGRDYPFYVMRYVRGIKMSEYLAKHGTDWFPLIGFHLLGRLASLHEAGWVFGDLKPENVLVGDYGKAQLVDFGGVTELGKSVRQFTEIYDRGYWTAGSRSADAQYDIFSFAVLIIQLFESRRIAQLTATLLPQNRVAEELMKIARQSAPLQPLQSWLRKALGGGFVNARDAAASWQKTLRPVAARRRHPPSPRWMKRMFVISAMMLATTVIWFIWTNQ
ncbi:serine/threonine protein kinase [Paenibacillaceae bacterium]|nr:serine/threonine protein kinase [Paenibacillaceae bacterium]